MELYITIKWAYNYKTKDWHAYPYFWITAIKSCLVDLCSRYEGGLGACVKRGNVEVNLDLVIEQVKQSRSVSVWDHGIGNPWKTLMVLECLEPIKRLFILYCK